MSNQSKSPFPESVRDLIRVKDLSYRTEEAYLGWIHHFILFHDKRHPKEMGAAEPFRTSADRAQKIYLA